MSKDARNGHREGPRAQLAFELYLGMEHRSLRQLRTILGHEWDGKAPSWGTLSNWSCWFDWDRRAREHDAQVAAETERATREAEVTSRRRRHQQRLRSAEVAQEKVLQAVELLDPQQLAARPADLVALMRQANADQRLDDGLATSRPEVAGTVQYHQPPPPVLGPEALDQLFRFLADGETWENTQKALGPPEASAVEPGENGWQSEEAPLGWAEEQPPS